MCEMKDLSRAADLLDHEFHIDRFEFDIIITRICRQTCCFVRGRH